VVSAMDPYGRNLGFLDRTEMSTRNFSGGVKRGKGARGSVDGRRAMLQAGRCRVRVPIMQFFFNSPHPSSRHMTFLLTQSLIEMSTRNLPKIKDDKGVRLTG
jgi:hypothetical protein